jgi:hypothetical protein
MLQFPFEVPSSIEAPGATPFEQVCGFVVLYLVVLALISFLLPRPLFVALFKIAFPFMPDRLEDFDDRD